MLRFRIKIRCFTYSVLPLHSTVLFLSIRMRLHSQHERKHGCVYNRTILIRKSHNFRSKTKFSPPKTLNKLFSYDVRVLGAFSRIFRANITGAKHDKRHENNYPKLHLAPSRGGQRGPSWNLARENVCNDSCDQLTRFWPKNLFGNSSLY